MKTLISGHRAVLGLAGVVALAALFASLTIPEVSLWVELALVAAAAAGIYAIAASPYWRIVYRESPLRRAVRGVSDLDERELALRDRAHGLTYVVFAAFHLSVLGACSALTDLDKLTLNGEVLQATLLPYAWFALTLPVIMLEWFEPSGGRASDGEDEG